VGFTFMLSTRRTKHHSDRYNLGPNGGILTALNLFTTKFDQVLDLVEKRADTVEYFDHTRSVSLKPTN
jgi:hypothetical protein